MRHLLAILVTALAAYGSSAAVKSYDMGPAGVLALDMPDGWSLTPKASASPDAPTFRVVPPAGVQLVLLLTPYPVPQALDPEAAARPMVESLAADLGVNAVEATLPLKTIDGDVARGFYVSATDKTVVEPTATNFKYVEQGIVALGPIHLKFTVLSNLVEGPVRAQARTIVRGARISPPGAPPQSPSGTIKLAVPGEPWALALDLPGFALDPIETRPDGRGVRIRGEHPGTHVIASVYVEEAETGKTAIDYREQVWRGVQAEDTAIERDDKRSMRGAIAVLEYRVPQLQGIPLNQKQVNAILVHGGMWIDVHLSKVRFGPADDALFEKIVGSMRIVAKATGTPTGN